LTSKNNNEGWYNSAQTQQRRSRNTGEGFSHTTASVSPG